MKVITSLKDFVSPGETVVTVGVFDGVHVGHKAVISKVVSKAGTLGLASAVITFDPHPAKVLRKKAFAPSLISLKHRERLISELNIDLLVIIRFTRAVSDMSPADFVKKVLVDKLKAREIYVGENFYFGKGANAGAPELVKSCEAFDLKAGIVRSVRIAGHVVSSSLIRKTITAGRLAEAKKYLGRPVSILGTVVSGSKFARLLGYPTANINPHHEVMPPFGVYAVMVNFRGTLYKGILNIGTKPTFFSPRDKEPNIEVHIFGFNERIYGKDLEILFVRKIRDERRFAGPEELARQITRDALIAQKILAS